MNKPVPIEHFNWGQMVIETVLAILPKSKQKNSKNNK